MKAMRIALLVSVILVVSSVLGTIGCRQSSGELFPVEGVVKWTDGKVAVELIDATLELRPTDSSSELVSPRAEIKSDGSFVFRTYQAGDGVPPGAYEVVLMPVIRGTDETGQVPRIVDKKYERFDTSPLKLNVDRKPNEVVLTIERK